MKPFNSNLANNANELRKNMTPEEKHLWYDFLKRLPFNAYRQHIIGNYIVDFYIPKKQIVIELDGIQHLEKEHQERDAARDEFLESQGLTVLRYPNEAINKSFTPVCLDILSYCGLQFEDLKDIK